MSRKLKSIYELLNEYSEEAIDWAISQLSNAEKDIVLARYGDDLHSATTTELWQESMNYDFYSKILPKIRVRAKKYNSSKKTDAAEPVKTEILSESALLITTGEKIETFNLKEEEKKISTKITTKQEKKNNVLITDEYKNFKPYQVKTHIEIQKFIPDGTVPKHVSYEDVSNSELEAQANDNSQKKSTIQKVNPAKIVSFLNTPSSLASVQEEFKLNNEELLNAFKSLKMLGIDFMKKYYADGNVILTKANCTPNARKVNRDLNSQYVKIHTEQNMTHMKFLVISDLHIGNAKSDTKLLDSCYNYCIQNDIHSIICTGDFIDGKKNAYSKQKIASLVKQALEFTKVYPFDKGIITYGVAGNHDMEALIEEGINLKTLCNARRPDIVIAGYNNGVLNIKDEQIHLYHHIDNGVPFDLPAHIMLHGHAHKYVSTMNENKLDIVVPSLSNIFTTIPSALELDISFENNLIKSSLIKHIGFVGTKSIILSETNFAFDNTSIISKSNSDEVSAKVLTKKTNSIN